MCDKWSVSSAHAEIHDDETRHNSAPRQAARHEDLMGGARMHGAADDEIEKRDIKINHDGSEEREEDAATRAQWRK